MHFFGGGPYGFCDLAKNHFNTEGFGIQFDNPQATIGNQFWHENTWLPNVGSYLGGSGANGINAPAQFRFYYDNINPPPPAGTTYLAPNASGGNWFDALTKSSPSSSACVNGGDFGTPLNEFDKGILDGTTFFSNPTEFWDNKRRMLFKGLAHPEWMNSSPNYPGFMTSNVGTSTYSFASFALSLQNAVTPDNLALVQNYQSLQTGFLSLSKSISESDSLLEIATDSLARIQIEATLENLATQLSTNSHLRDSIAQLFDDEQYQQLIALNSSIGGLPDITSQEFYNKRLLQFCINRLLGILTLAELSEIRTIAHLCIDSVGEVVQNVRGLLPLEEMEAMVDDNDSHTTRCSIERNQSEQQNIQPDRILLYPNPADGDLITIKLPANRLINRIMITDQLGRIVLDNSIDERAESNWISINVSTLSGGWFVLQAIGDKNESPLPSLPFFIIR